VSSNCEHIDQAAAPFIDGSLATSELDASIEVMIHQCFDRAAVATMVMIDATSPMDEGPGHATSWEPVGQSGIGSERGLAGIESNLRRQLVCLSR
jgi:acyl-CoA reductase-like NAD-dependent aldehyde dehydrogenase